MSLEEIERLELKYLNKYFYFLKFVENEMFIGFKTKEKIKDDWYGLYGNYEGKGISDFAVGAERIVYSLINGKGIGQPNSCPVGSDLFFEVDDAYIHIDMKTVQQDNIGDFTNNIFVGENQNSYKGTIIKKKMVKNIRSSIFRLCQHFIIRERKLKKYVYPILLLFCIIEIRWI